MGKSTKETQKYIALKFMDFRHYETEKRMKDDIFNDPK